MQLVTHYKFGTIWSIWSKGKKLLQMGHLEHLEQMEQSFWLCFRLLHLLHLLQMTHLGQRALLQIAPPPIGGAMEHGADGARTKKSWSRIPSNQLVKNYKQKGRARMGGDLDQFLLQMHGDATRTAALERGARHLPPCLAVKTWTPSKDVIFVRRLNSP